MCSTPYGINGLGRQMLIYLFPFILTVFNALRHQWFRQQNTRKFLEERELCSTPYGINGLGRFDLFNSLFGSFMCSTPYGINGLGRTGLQKF